MMQLHPFKNVTLKLVALILAIIIWFLVVGEQRSEVRLTVPLELRNLPTDLEITQSVSQVEITLRGFSSFVKRLTPGDIDVYIDLSNVVQGTNSFILSPEEIVVPIGATVIQVSPSNIEVFLDATVRKTLTVEPVLRGQPADGYILGEMTVIPETIKVAGAQTLLKTLSKVETEVISLDGIKEHIIKKVKVKLPNSSLRIEKEEERVVEVQVNIEPEMIDRFFEEIPLLVQKEETRSFKLSPESITALVYGPKLTLLQMKSADIPAIIETIDLPEGQSIVQVHFDLPDAMKVKIYYPKTITITITEKH
ncbi:MAG: CdaR family protein [Candidatus Vecturithrix sp.]|jgi:YbbR domain-containing protein|nr:CdaR family protein [Candidatus Vecturithrix sp.]